MKNLFLIGLISTLVLLGCGRVRQYGKPVDPTAPHFMTTELGDIPADIAKAEVMLMGKIIDGACDAGCWVILQDELGTVKVMTSDIGVVDLPGKRKTVFVQGKIQIKDGVLIVNASGIEIR